MHDGLVIAALVVGGWNLLWNVVDAIGRHRSSMSTRLTWVDIYLGVTTLGLLAALLDFIDWFGKHVTFTTH